MVLEIILLIIFFICFVFGFFLIYRQVALVKKGEFNNKDRIQCIFYGFIFSSSVMVVIAMAFNYVIETPEFWDVTPPDLHSFTLIAPFIICLIYISIYPLLDFIFIAQSRESDEGLTVFHKIMGSKIINLTKTKLINTTIAIILYVCLFIVPPLLLTLLGLPFIMIWITWMIAYPLMILTHYGSKGYIAGISNAYYHIPNINRSIYLNFEDSKRGFKQFISDPGPYIIMGLMIFVFVWAWISLFQTIAFFFTGTLAISTMSSVFVFVTLFFGIVGYFTRFWGRKIKYRGIDIYFAAYLMAVIGINVLVNFLIANPDEMNNILSGFSLTNQIVPNSLMFTWAAVIEEIVLIFFTSYYFLAKNNEFIKNVKYSKVTQCGQTFDPVPLFNFIKHRDLRIRDYAIETIFLMFERIPLKNPACLNEWKFKKSLLDGICDDNSTTRKISYRILKQLQKDTPHIILPWLIESLNSPNLDKNIPVLSILSETDDEFIEKIPKETFANLLNDSDWRLKLLGVKIISRLIRKDTQLIIKFGLNKLINDPNPNIQKEILRIYSESPLLLPGNIIFDKILHTDDEIRAAAVGNLKNTTITKLDKKDLSKIIPLMEDPSSAVRASIFAVLAKTGKFKRNKIPILPFIEGLTDFDGSTRKSAVSALNQYYQEEPNLLDIDEIISKIDPHNYETLNTIVSLLGKLWLNNPEKILSSLLIFIKLDNNQLQTQISNIIVEKYDVTPNIIIKNLIKITDTSGYITKGIIAKTIIKISKKDPINIVPKLVGFLGSDNEEIDLNVISVLDGMVEDIPKSTNLGPFIQILKEDKSNQLKNEVSKLFSKIAQEDPNFIKPLIANIIQLAPEQETPVKIVLFKSLLNIAAISPETLPLEFIIKYISDPDSFIRESSTKMLGFIGYKDPIATVDALINIALIDDDWIVREAAVSSLGQIIDHVEDKKIIIEKLIKQLEGEKGWVRRSALKILSKIANDNEIDLQFDILAKYLADNDPKVREASAGLVFIYKNQTNEIFDEILKLLNDDVKEVRMSIINSVVKIIQRIGLESLLSKLLKNLSDEGSIETQRSIALILGRTVKYEKEKIKERVISLLKIRCEMSQDPIICSTYQQLMEG
ncbi:MAG: HEAT repeat domain-containing protein [Promethearchaeota archaeon]